MCALAAGGAGTPRPGWLRAAASLLYYDAAGALSGEIGLGRWEESDPSRLHEKVINGGTSPDKRFAWTLETRNSWNTLKTKLEDSRRILRLFGPNGRELWNEDGADFLPDSAPLVFSRNAESCLLAVRRKEGWFVAAKTYLGNTTWEVGPFPRLESLQISPNGRYGAARWSEPDKRSMHSFLEPAAKTRKDVPSSQFLLGRALVDDLGRIQTDKKVIFSFAAPASSEDASAEPSAGPAPSPGGRP